MIYLLIDLLFMGTLLWSFIVILQPKLPLKGILLDDLKRLIHIYSDMVLLTWLEEKKMMMLLIITKKKHTWSAEAVLQLYS